MDALARLDGRAQEEGIELEADRFFTAIYWAPDDKDRRVEVWRRVRGNHENAGNENRVSVFILLGMILVILL